MTNFHTWKCAADTAPRTVCLPLTPRTEGSMEHRPNWDHRLVGVKPDKPAVKQGMSPGAPSFLGATDRNDICHWAARRCAERTTELCATADALTCDASFNTLNCERAAACRPRDPTRPCGSRWERGWNATFSYVNAQITFAPGDNLAFHFQHSLAHHHRG